MVSKMSSMCPSFNTIQTDGIPSQAYEEPTPPSSRPCHFGHASSIHKIPGPAPLGASPPIARNPVLPYMYVRRQRCHAHVFTCRQHGASAEVREPEHHLDAAAGKNPGQRPVDLRLVSTRRGEYTPSGPETAADSGCCRTLGRPLLPLPLPFEPRSSGLIPHPDPPEKIFRKIFRCEPKELKFHCIVMCRLFSGRRA